jgi:hypothetical protein
VKAVRKEWFAPMVIADVSAPQPNGNERPPSSGVDTETLNFRVMAAFKKEFKGYAVSQGMTMVELLKEGFELSKRNRKQ